VEEWQEAVARLKAALEEYQHAIKQDSRSRIWSCKTRLAEIRIHEQKMYQKLIQELQAS
jgi:hypothetical protein